MMETALQWKPDQMEVEVVRQASLLADGDVCCCCSYYGYPGPSYF
jgi:hypothetical protein